MRSLGRKTLFDSLLFLREVAREKLDRKRIRSIFPTCQTITLLLTTLAAGLLMMTGCREREGAGRES